MNPKRIYAIFLRQIYLFKDNPPRFFQMFVWATTEIILWGFTSRYFSNIADPKLKLVATLLGSILLWEFLTQVMQGVTMAFFEDVWARNFLNIFASPLSISEYILGLIATSVARGLLSFLVITVLAALFFGFTFTYGASILLFILILFLCGITLGLIGVSIILKLGPSAEWFVWPIPALVSPLVGVIYPIATLPAWLQHISRILPPTYVFAGIRSIVGGHAFSSHDFALGLALAIFYLALAYWIFLRVYRTAIRTGLIARYSAESVV